MPKRPIVAVVTNLERDAHYLFPGYRRTMLNADYPEAIADAGGVPMLLPPHPDTTLLAEQLGAADALVLAGGSDVDPLRYGQLPHTLTQMPNRTRDAYEFAALDIALDAGMPVLAICRGIQLLNVYLGGTLHQDTTLAGSSVRHAGTSEPDAPAHPVTVAPGSFLHLATGRSGLMVNSFHHQAIDALAPGLVVAASAADGLVEAVELTGAPAGRPRPTAPVVGVQWHPEMMFRGDEDSAAIFRWFVDLVTEVEDYDFPRPRHVC